MRHLEWSSSTWPRLHLLPMAGLQPRLLWLVLLAATGIITLVAGATLRRLLDGRLLVPEG